MGFYINYGERAFIPIPAVQILPTVFAPTLAALRAGQNVTASLVTGNLGQPLIDRC
jgi:hypothetical protein